VLAYSTYLGGSWQDMGERIAVDAAGNTYVDGFDYFPRFPHDHRSLPDD